MLEHLFVYGTLAPGRPNEHILTDIGGEWEEASVLGNLHPEGWGAQMGCPGIVLDEKGGRVVGSLFSSTELADHWDRLDVFEGEAYRRVVTEVERPEKPPIEAYIYELRR